MRHHLMAYRLPDGGVVGIEGVGGTPSAALRDCLRRVGPMPDSGQRPDLERVAWSLDGLTPEEQAQVEADRANDWPTDLS